MRQTVHVGVRVPIELIEAARTATQLPEAGDTAVIRYALARLAGFDPAEHARHRKSPGRPRKVKAADQRERAA